MTKTENMLSRDAARIVWIELMLPSLWAGGSHRLAASYSVERDRLVARIAASS